MMTKLHARHFVMFVMVFFAGASLVWAKNPFDSCLPEKPKEEAQVVKSAEKKPDLPANQQPKIEVKIEPPVLALTGLIWNSSRPQAIIDGKVVKVGDVVKDVKINKITRSGVEGDFKGVKVQLKP